MLSAECGDLTLIAFEGRGSLRFRAIVEIVSEPLLDGFDYPTLEAAKLAAETFAREWIAAQASALGDGGEWTSALPTEPGWYWTRTSEGGPILLDRLTPSTALGYWGKYFRRWSVPVQPPPLPVDEVEE
jgi:hypothetical protein